jgi:hypothetical protein
MAEESENEEVETDEGSDEGEESTEAETKGDDENVETTKPGEWERKPADPEDLRHDDGSEPLAEPSDEDDDDLAEQEEGDVSASGDDDDEGFDRPETTEEEGLEETGSALEDHGEPLLQGSEVAGVPTRSLLAMALFVLVFCIVFFALWGLLGNLGIFLGIFAGPALGLLAMKMLADRQRTA